MSFGLEIYNSNGDAILTGNSRLARIHTTITITNLSGGSCVDYSIPGITDDGTWMLLENVGCLVMSIPTTGTLRVCCATYCGGNCNGITVYILRW